jgi:hypothetical protein
MPSSERKALDRPLAGFPPDRAATRADKAVRPAGALKIGSARRIIGKQTLERGE